LEKAKEYLKKKGMAQAQKKSDRETHEGVVRCVYENGRVLGVKVLCETDFVAKNEAFQAMVDHLFSLLREYSKNADNLSALEAQDADFAQKLHHTVQECVGKLGENMRLDDIYIKSGKAHVYNHPGDKISSVVFYQQTTNDESLLHQVAKDVCLQIAAMNPLYLDMDSVPLAEQQLLESQFQKELENSGKPEEIVRTIVQ
jgi:elongation factor Ts